MKSSLEKTSLSLLVDLFQSINIGKHLYYLLTIHLFTVCHVPSPDSLKIKVPLVSLQTTWLFSMWLPGVLWLNTSTWCLWSWATLSLWMLINPLLIIFFTVEASISNIRRACVLTCALLLVSVMSSGSGSLQILLPSGCDFGFMLFFFGIFIPSSAAFQSC